MGRLAEEIAGGAKGACDGLVFMPEKDWMATGRATNVFKGKPPGRNTIDLAFDGSEWRTAGNAVQYAIALEGDPPSAPGIYELRPVGNRRWAVEKPRPDKKAPNHETTVWNTILTMEEGITMEDILRLGAAKK